MSATDSKPLEETLINLKGFTMEIGGSVPTN